MIELTATSGILCWFHISPSPIHHHTCKYAIYKNRASVGACVTVFNLYVARVGVDGELIPLLIKYTISASTINNSLSFQRTIAEGINRAAVCSKAVEVRFKLRNEEACVLVFFPAVLHQQRPRNPI